MKKGRILLVSSIVLLIVSFLPLQQILPALSTSKGNFELDAKHRGAGFSQFLPFLSVSAVDITVSNVGPIVTTDVFEIVDSQGTIMVHEDHVYARYYVEWVPMKAFGTYNFGIATNFVSSNVEGNYQTVFYSLRIYPYSTILFIIGVLLLILSAIQIIREEHPVLRLKNLLGKNIKGLIKENN